MQGIIQRVRLGVGFPAEGRKLQLLLRLKVVQQLFRIAQRCGDLAGGVLQPPHGGLHIPGSRLGRGHRIAQVVHRALEIIKRGPDGVQPRAELAGPGADRILIGYGVLRRDTIQRRAERIQPRLHICHTGFQPVGRRVHII